jgi:hypothetical protein
MWPLKLGRVAAASPQDPNPIKSHPMNEIWPKALKSKAQQNEYTRRCALVRRVESVFIFIVGSELQHFWLETSWSIPVRWQTRRRIGRRPGRFTDIQFGGYSSRSHFVQLRILNSGGKHDQMERRRNAENCKIRLRE